MEEAAARGGLWSVRGPKRGFLGGDGRRQGEARGVEPSGPDPRHRGVGSRAGAAFPDLAGRAHRVRGVKRYPRSVRINARGPLGGECTPLLDRVLGSLPWREARGRGPAEPLW